MQLFKDKYIIVTGGAGFIGSGVIKDLNDQGYHNILVVDDLGENAQWKNLVKKKFLDFIHKDHLFDWLPGKKQDIEAIIHLGACSSTTETDANYLLENNYSFSIELAEYALENRHRFIYASSAATYGDGKAGFSDQHQQLDQYAPLNMYGFSKHLFDLWLKEQDVLDQVVGLKYFNVFGPNEYHKGRMASAVIKMVQDAQTLGKISLFQSSDPKNYGDGEQVRDFIYIKDAAKMTTQFLTNDLGGIFNIGTGKPQTWNALARAVVKALNHSVSIEYIPMPEDLVGIYQNYTCAETEKSCSLFQPAYSLESGVQDYVQNYILPHKYW